jgi:hypothetical protein
MGRGEMMAPEPKTVGARVIEGLEQAIAWTKGEDVRVRVTLVDVPEVDVRGVPRAAGRSRNAPRGG